MKNPLRWAWCVVLLTASAWGAEEFSKSLSAEEFAAAGLGKLTPAELARLDALVRGERTGEIARVREETAAQVKAETTATVKAEEAAKVRAEVTAQVKAEVTAQVKAEVVAQVTAEVKAQAAAAKPAEQGSLLHRLSVVLAPGTDIKYAEITTTLVGSYRGYEPGKVLTLANGQTWRVVEGTYWVPARDADKPRKVVIEPGVLGSFFLKIEDGGRPKVKIVSNGN